MKKGISTSLVEDMDLGNWKSSSVVCEQLKVLGHERDLEVAIANAKKYVI